MAIVTVAVLSIAVQMVYGQLSGQLLEMRREHCRATLQALTDAAVAGSLAGLDADPGFPGLAERELGEGAIRSRVVAEADGTRSLFALATLDGERSGVRLRVLLTDHGPKVTSLEPWKPTSDLAPLPTGPRRAIDSPLGRS